MVVCPHCKKNTPDGKYCEHCGAELQIYQLPVTPSVPKAERSHKKWIIIGGMIVVVLVVFLGIFIVTGKQPTAPWSGSWDTNWGIMTLSQSGDQVTGTYVYRSGRISGTVTGNTLTGTWSESPTYQPPEQAGDVILKLSNDRMAITGDWRYGSSGGWSGDWRGKKI
jgi:hypothetical protein